MSVNNETGYIQDVGNISREIKRKNHSTCFHTDAVQGFCKIPMNFKDSDIDLISVSSHKIHGPKGVGAIAIKAGKSISPFFYGGGQESNIRPGTENVPGIAAFGKAAYDAFENTSNNFEVVSAIKNMFINSFSNDDIDAKIISDLNSSPYIFNIGFANVKSEVVLHHLSSEGIFVSSGSACASKNKKISRVLKAMNVENKYIEGTIRFSFCKENTISEAERTIEVLKKIIPIISQK
jgi:cysteine desulfurase